MKTKQQKRPRLAVGEIWHVELPHAKGLLDTVTISQLTDKTVLLDNFGIPTPGRVWSQRFELGAVRFVERIEARVTPLTNKVVWAGTGRRAGACGCVVNPATCAIHGTVYGDEEPPHLPGCPCRACQPKLVRPGED